MESDRVTTKLIQGDCLKIMPALEPKSTVDYIFKK